MEALILSLRLLQVLLGVGRVEGLKVFPLTLQAKCV
jgi:hypothetical protein